MEPNYHYPSQKNNSIISKDRGIKINRYLLISATLFFLVIGQLFGKIGSAHVSLSDLSIFQFFNQWILLGYVCMFMQGFIWILVLKKTNLSLAYPFMSLSFVFILILSYFILNESISLGEVAGSFLIITGVIFISLSKKEKRLVTWE